jgi:hypothetical protein
MRFYKLIFTMFLFFGAMGFAEESGLSSFNNLKWKLIANTELGFEYIENSYFSTSSTQDNIWNQEVKELGELELGFKFKPQKKIKLKVELKFDKNYPQPKMKDFWVDFNLKSKQNVKLGYFKNQLGRSFNTSKKTRLGLNKTYGQELVKTALVMERDFGIQYLNSFRKSEQRFSFGLKGSIDASKNIFGNPSLSFQTNSLLFKADYVGVLSERKEYSLSLYNNLGSLASEFWIGEILKNLPTYKLLNEFLGGDNVNANFKSQIMGEENRDYFFVLEQKHSLAVKHELSFLKASQYVIGFSMLNPSSMRNFESIGGLNLHLTEASSLVWKSELLWRFLSKKGFTVASSLQFFL